MKAWHKKLLTGILVAAFWLGVWYLVSFLVGLPLILPSPVDTFRALLQLMGQGEFWLSVVLSMARILLGYLLAVLLGTALGVLSAFSSFGEALLRPLRSIIKATPVVSFILLVLLWVKKGMVPVFIAFLMVLPMIWATVQQQIRQVDPMLLEMGRVFRFSRFKAARLIYIPSILPAFSVACVTGIGFAWKAGVAAEVLARSANSIGKHLIESKNYLEMPDMFAWTATLIVLSILLEKLLVKSVGRIKGGLPAGKEEGR